MASSRKPQTRVLMESDAIKLFDVPRGGTPCTNVYPDPNPRFLKWIRIRETVLKWIGIQEGDLDGSGSGQMWIQLGWIRNKNSV